jgi:hypothetical protein
VATLAGVLQSLGKYDEAEKLNRRALEGMENELGVQHPDTLNSIYCLAYLLHNQKGYADASELHQRACDGHKQTLGSEHPRTIACVGFSSMRQGVEQERVKESKTSIDNDNVVPRQTPIRGFTTPNSNRATPNPISSNQKDKQDSVYTRLKRRIRGKDL